jgi:CHASE3 domain sensor protein
VSPHPSIESELNELQQRVCDRLEELEPLVVEYHELQELAARLGLDAPRAAVRARAARPLRRVTRADQVMELVRSRPGATVHEIADALGLDPTGLYRVVRALERERKLVKDGRRLLPA